MKYCYFQTHLITSWNNTISPIFLRIARIKDRDKDIVTGNYKGAYLRMYHVSIQTHFSAAHHLRNYNGQCENLHGHNWKVEVAVSAEQLDEAGMAIDFTILKEKTTTLIKQLDHHNLNDIAPFTTINPSSENIAAYLYALLAEALKDYRVKLTTVSVWESETSKASYTP